MNYLQFRKQLFSSDCCESEPGATGSIGATGAQGLNGATGPQGLNGATGPTGPAGSTGPQGAPGTAAAQGDTGPTGPALVYSVNNIPNFYVRNKYTLIARKKYFPGNNYMYLDECNGIPSSGGLFPGENAGLASYISGTLVGTDTNIITGGGGTKWVCHQSGIFAIDCTSLWDYQNQLALYGIAIEVNEDINDLRYIQTDVHAMTEEWCINLSAVLPLQATDRFRIVLFVNATLDMLVIDPPSPRYTQLNIMQIA